MFPCGVTHKKTSAGGRSSVRLLHRAPHPALICLGEHMRNAFQGSQEVNEVTCGRDVENRVVPEDQTSDVPLHKRDDSDVSFVWAERR